MSKLHLTKAQLRYIEIRLGDVEAKERAKIDVSCHLPLNPGTTFGDFIRGIKSGKIKLAGHEKRDREITRNTLLYVAFPNVVPVESYPKMDTKKYNALIAQHELKWQAIWDKIHLGSAPEALALLQELEGSTKA